MVNAKVRSVVVTRHRHPFEGCSLVVLGQMTRHGALEVLVVLPDGSKTLMPARWTDHDDAGAAQDIKGSGISATATLASIGDLLPAAALVSDLGVRPGDSDAQQAAGQPPRKEDDRAACAAESDTRGRVDAKPGGRRVAARPSARHRDRDAGPIDSPSGRLDKPRGRQ